MSKIITGYHFDTGTRELYEDRVRAGTIKRSNGDTLAYALVADGVGGENRGERAAQLAVDAILVYLETGNEQSVPALLSKAIHSANHEVYWSTKSDKGTSTTLSLAVVHNNETLFIANVGDSRVYLVRKDKITQLTLDHTFQYIIPIQDKMSPEAAAESPRADVLMHALGIDETVPVDIGFHVGQTTTEREYILAQARGKKGLPLKTGDSILVCSDGLIKDSPTDGSPLIQDEEIIQVLSAQEGNRAARGLVSFALGRDADDNVSAAILQTPDSNRKDKAVDQQRQVRRQAAFYYGGIAAVTIALFGLATFLFFRGQSNTTIEAEQTRNAIAALETSAADELIAQTRVAEANQLDQEASAIRQTADALEENRELAILQTQTVEAIIAATQQAVPTATPIPTNTPRPTLAPGQIGFFRGRSQDELQPLFEDEALVAVENMEIQINHEGLDDEDASIYAIAGGEVEFSQVARQVEFRLFEESNILIDTGLYQSGAEIEVRASDDDITFTVFGSCMAVKYSEVDDEITAACFEGSCNFRIDRQASVSIETGNQVTFNSKDLSQTPLTVRIPETTASSYQSLLSDFPGGIIDAASCLQPYLPATPTPTPTPTIVIPTDTPTATPVPSGGGSSSGGNSGSGSSGGGSGGGSNPTAAPQPTDPAPVRPTSLPERPTAAPDANNP
ncbi:MAG: protein phosphatase 2C domain-containing protein [Chloroflexota bacterium]